MLVSKIAKKKPQRGSVDYRFALGPEPKFSHWPYTFNYFLSRCHLRWVPLLSGIWALWLISCETFCRSVGTLILCDCCYFRSKKTTKIT